MKFRKRPVVIEAEQFFESKEPWPSGVEKSDTTSVWGPRKMPRDKVFIIRTPEGPMAVTEGDWVITGTRGEQYPCKPDIFKDIYEPVESSQEEPSK